MWISNGKYWKTGYGNQSALFLPRLKAAGYDPVEFAFTDRTGAPAVRDDILTIGQRFDTFGNDVYEAHMKWTRCDFSLGLYDFFVSDQTVYGQNPHVQFAVVDSEPLRPDLASALRKGARWVWAISRFGEKQLKAAGFECDYVPHGIDTKVYKPGDRKEARRLIQQAIDADEPEREYSVKLEDKFVVLMNAANNDNRKGFYEALIAWKEFHAAHPDSILYLHTDMTGVRGENLFTYFETLDIDPKGSIVYPNQYFYHMGMIGAETMADLYNTADVLLSPSYAEGFGIPILEAQACGCPVIVTDCSSMSELCYSGVKVPVVATYARHAGLYWKIPSIPAIAGALESCYWTHDDPRDAVALKVQHYDADRVFEDYWLPALKRVEADLKIDKSKSVEHTHKWARVGLANKGRTVVPCLVGNCEAGHSSDGSIIPHAFPAKIGDIELDIEDDPDGGVSKIVAWEIINTYHLDMVDLRPGDVAVDIGAHVGVVSCYLAKRFKSVKVMAYEPQPDNYVRLLRNIKTNHAAVVAGHRAVTKDGRKVAIPGKVGDNAGGNNIYGADLSTAVSSITFDDVLLDWPALIKIDCEGAEYEILEGKTALLDGVRYVIGEFHINKTWPKERAEKLVAELKAVVPNVWVTFCPVPDLPEPVKTNGSGSKRKTGENSALDRVGVPDDFTGIIA
jgi:FkbM family methyltransferase